MIANVLLDGRMISR